MSTFYHVPFYKSAFLGTWTLLNVYSVFIFCTHTVLCVDFTSLYDYYVPVVSWLSEYFSCRQISVTKSFTPPKKKHIIHIYIYRNYVPFNENFQVNHFPRIKYTLSLLAQTFLIHLQALRRANAHFPASLKGPKELGICTNKSHLHVFWSHSIWTAQGDARPAQLKKKCRFFVTQTWHMGTVFLVDERWDEDVSVGFSCGWRWYRSVVEQGDDLSTFGGGSLMKHSAVFWAIRIVDLHFLELYFCFLLLLTNLRTHIIYVYIFVHIYIYIQNICFFFRWVGAAFWDAGTGSSFWKHQVVGPDTYDAFHVGRRERQKGLLNEAPCETSLFQWLFQIIPQLAVFTTYIPLVYCQLGDYMVRTTY